MTPLQAQNYLNSFINYERLNRYPAQASFKLARVAKLLRLLGNPHQGLRCIHIAGTKGKGSTCAFIAHILKEAGFKVGLYTSPHLVDVRERIRILRRADNPTMLKLRRASREQITEKEFISKKDFAGLLERIGSCTEKLRKAELSKLSYFEILTCLAFLYFAEERCDFVVLETGIGGRLDATNVIESWICAILPISYEHMQVLGNTLEKIAQEKAGIIKNRVHKKDDKKQIVVTAPQRPQALETIRRQAKRRNADLFVVGEDIKVSYKSADVYGQSFEIKGIFGKYSNLKVRLLGKHQVVNAAVAVGCIEALSCFGVDVNLRAIRDGLKAAQWSGRLQVIAQKPRIVLDGAQNRASAFVLKQALKEFFKFRKLILVFGASKDKDVRGMLSELSPIASRIILTKSQNPRAMAPEIMKTFVKENTTPLSLTSNSSRALEIARQNASQQDLILVTGSLFLVGDILKSERVFKQ